MTLNSQVLEDEGSSVDEAKRKETKKPLKETETEVPLKKAKKKRKNVQAVDPPGETTDWSFGLS